MRFATNEIRIAISAAPGDTDLYHISIRVKR